MHYDTLAHTVIYAGNSADQLVLLGKARRAGRRRLQFCAPCDGKRALRLTQHLPLLLYEPPLLARRLREREALAHRVHERLAARHLLLRRRELQGEAAELGSPTAPAWGQARVR